MTDLHVVIPALWLLFVLAAYPRMAEPDVFDHRSPLMALAGAFLMPLGLIAVPVFAVTLILTILILDEIPRRVVGWWSSDWSPQ